MFGTARFSRFIDCFDFEQLEAYRRWNVKFVVMYTNLTGYKCSETCSSLATAIRIANVPIQNGTNVIIAADDTKVDLCDVLFRPS